MARLLAGRYELAAPIGRGPTGTVWSARDSGTREHLAVKVLDPKLTADQHIVDRFERERYVLTSFLHPCYVRVRDVVVEDRLIALVTELVHGADLRVDVDRWHPMAPAQAVAVAATVAEALAAGHDTGVVHCDVKPSNVMLEEDGPVRVTDCRVGRLARGYGSGANRFATPEYVAPEVILGGPPVPASDVYGLGLVLYEMLTGIMPYRGGELDEALARHLRAELVVPMTVPGELRRLVEACTSVDERIRPTAAQLAHALRRLLPELGGLPAIEPLPTGTPLLHTVRRAPDAGPVAVPVRPASGPPYTPPYAPSAAPEAYPADEPVPVLLTTAPVPEPARTRTPSPNLRIVVVAAAALLVAVAAVVVVRGLGNNRNPAPQAGLPRSNGVQSTAAATDANVTGPPAAAVPATQDGAKAFVTYWFDSLNRALATGDVGLLQAASGPNCHTCANAIQVVKAGYADGGRLRGGLFTVREVTVDNFFDINKPRLGVIVDRAPRSSVAADGHQLQVFPGGTFITGFVLLERVQDHWRILDVGSDHPLV